MAPELEWIGGEAEFAALAEEWDALASGSPFDLHCWYAAWWKAFGAGSELDVCLLRRDGELAGVFPLRRERGRLKAMANVHTPSYRPLARDPGALERVGPRRGRRRRPGPLWGARGRRPDRAARRVRLGRLPDPADRAVLLLADGGHERRFRRLARDQQEALGGTPGAIPAQDGPRSRGRAEDRRGSPSTSTRSSPTAFGSRPAAGRGSRARRSSPPPRRRPSTPRSPGPSPRASELRFSRIALDGVTASFDFTLLHGGRLYLLKTGFDERFRKLAPGLVMRLSIIERCFELGLDSHELLGDESEWKSKFATGTRPHANFDAYPRRLAGLLRYAYRAALRPRLKRVYRRVVRNR